MESQSSCLKFDLWLFIQVLNKYCQHFPVLSTLAECWWDLDLLAGFTFTKMSKCKCQIVESMTIFYSWVLGACKWHMYIWRGESPVLMFRGRGDAQWEVWWEWWNVQSICHTEVLTLWLHLISSPQECHIQVSSSPGSNVMNILNFLISWN